MTGRAPVRRSLRTLLAASTTALLGVLSVGATAAPAGATPAGAPASTPVTCPVVAPSTLADYDALWDRFGGTWRAGDGGRTVRHPTDGSALFLFGDTALERPDGTRLMPHGTAVAWRGDTLVRASGDGSLVPDAPDGSWYWPGAAVTDAGRLYVFAAHERTAPGGWTPLGTDLAEFDWPPCSDPVFRRLLPTPSSGGDGVAWGAGAVTDGGWTYVYGTRDPDGFGRSVHVARVPVGRLADPGTWRYWDGAQWQADADRAVAVVGPAGGPQDGFEVGRQGGRFRFVSKAEGPLGHDVTRWSSPTPYGPWTRTVLFQSPYRPWDQRYLETAHYALPRIGGRVVTSTSHGRACLPGPRGAGCLHDALGVVTPGLGDLWDHAALFRNTHRTVVP